MASILIFRSLIFSQLLLLVLAQDAKCPSSFECGNLGTISFPFTNTQRPHCGVLAIHGCDDHNPQAPKSIQLSNTPTGRFIVVYVESHTITIKDASLRDYLQQKSCEAFSNNFTIPLSPSSPLGSVQVMNNITLFRCNHSPPITFPQFHKYTNCTGYDIYYGPPNTEIPPDFKRPSFLTSCSKIQLAVKDESDTSGPFSFLSDQILVEVQLSDNCRKCVDRERGQCQLDSQGKFYCARGSRSWVIRKVGLALGLASSIVVVLLLLLACCFRRKLSTLTIRCFWNKGLPTDEIIIQRFLKQHGSLPTRRYSYSEIKKFTKCLKVKLGQGGYGSVYKGKLQDGRLVAVKVLNELKGTGEEFINEVASISRTSHINIITLLGFCFQGSKRALVYEFMPNGSLEKFMYEENPNIVGWQLDCKTLYDITIGVAHGLDYLHRGCNTRIFHFDIKPHNILLDEHFCPKISDFGLAKICPRRESIVSMMSARGTIGYIAPEVFSRNFGGVSHKADVYSYGMMVLDMVGGKHNKNVQVDGSSELYFPHWIYKQLEINQDFGLLCIKNESDRETVRKMIVVSLWCIQIDPSSRPSMSKVVEMLEGSLESLELPPKPFLHSSPTSPTHYLAQTSETL